MTAQPRSLLIKGLVPGLPERGKVKIGGKGAKITSARGNEFQPPLKFDHFVITTMERGPDGNFKRDEAIHAKLGDKPTRIPVRLLYDDIGLNFQSRYAAFIGRTLWCSGDGEQADRLKGKGPEREAVACPCHRKEPDYKGQDRCKINGVLSVLIDHAGSVGGVWKFRTTSYNSTVGIMSSLAFIKRITGGPLAGVPLTLTVTPKQATDPDGKQQTVYVVGLEFAGTLDALQAEGYKIALNQAQHHLRIEHIETEARALLTGPTAPGQVFRDDDDAAENIAPEFYPDAAATQVEGDAAPPVSRMAALEQMASPEPDPPHDPETGEITEAPIVPQGDPPRDDFGLPSVPEGSVAAPSSDWITVMHDLEQEANRHDEKAMLKAWFTTSEDVARLKRGASDFYAELLGKVNARLKTLRK